MGIRDLVRRLYEFPTCSVTGGPLHIVVDDLNVNDSSLDFASRELDAGHWSLDRASEEDREQIVVVCRAILAALYPMSVKQRREALEAWWVG